MNPDNKKLHITIFIISTVLSLLFAEFILRLLNYPQIGCSIISDVAENSYARFDPTLGWSYKPHISTHGDYEALYTFNREGYRSNSLESTTDFSKPRILIIGDSFLFGHGLEFGETFGSKLAKALQNRYEVINFAVQAYGTDQMYLLLTKIFDIYQPQAVIMDFEQEHRARNISRDRREFYPCAQFIGTKTLFTEVKGELQLQSNALLYKDYDNPRLLLLVRKTFEKSLKQRVDAEGKLITKLLINTIGSYVSEKGSRLYVINIETGEKFWDQNISTVTIDLDQEKYYISSTDHHPNSLGVSMMIEQFLKKHREDF